MIFVLYSYLQLSLSDQAAGDLMHLPLLPFSAHQATIKHSSQFYRLLLIDIFSRYDFITNKTFQLSLDFSKYFPHSTPRITKKYD